MTGAQEREVKRMKKRHSGVTWVKRPDGTVKVDYTVNGLEGPEAKTTVLGPNGLPVTT